MMIKRSLDLKEIHKLLDIFPIVAIVGPRQCGKTTIAKGMKYDHYFDLENPRDLSRLENPQITLEAFTGLIIIDEIQRKPELFPLLRYLVDNNKNQQYLVLGSASPELIKNSSESLAGRIGYYQLGTFSLQDTGKESWQKLWFRGGYPRAYLANANEASQTWLQNYITTFVERDISQLGIQIPSQTINRFWVMLSHYHGQIINYAELGRSFGISDMTIRKYLDILSGTFMIRILPPWFVNLGKRLVKRPKIYLRDSGIFHSLMSIESETQLFTFNKLGASWEGFALENVCRLIQKSNRAVYFWATHAGAEVDLFWQKGGKNFAVEFKYTDAPKFTKSMKIAIQDLQLNHLWVVYPGKENYILNKNVTVFALQNVNENSF